MAPSGQLEPVICTLCGFSTKRLTTLERHFIEQHATTLQAEWNRLHDGPMKCACGCGQTTTFVGYKKGYAKFIIGHNANIYSSYDPKEAARLATTRGSNWLGKPSHWAGLTKKTSEAVNKRAEATSRGRSIAFEQGNIIAWSTGLTKETDERVARMATQIRDDFASGERKIWNKGKTEKTDERLKAKNDALRIAYVEGRLVPWHRGKTSADEPRLAVAWTKRNPDKEYEHVRWSPAEIEDMLKQNINIAIDRIEGYRNDRRPALWVHCRGCGWIEKVALVFARNDRCPKCSPVGSAGQHQLADWLQATTGLPMVRNFTGVFGRQEIDIWIPTAKLAIEFNGLYYHNEAAGKQQWYHDNKTKKCLELGIRLIHVFEDEWLHKQDIIKSMLLHRVGMTQHRTGARKLQLIELDRKQQHEFFEANHIDGSSDVGFKAAWGLVDDNDVIIAALSLKRPLRRKHREQVFEVARFCTKLNTSCSGALGRLTNAAKAFAKTSGTTTLMTFVDTRLGSSGEAWTKAGWTNVGETPPMFWWTDGHRRMDNNGQRFHRLKFKADKKRNLSEAQVAEKKDVVRIYGCRNLIFEYKTG